PAMKLLFEQAKAHKAQEKQQHQAAATAHRGVEDDDDEEEGQYGTSCVTALLRLHWCTPTARQEDCYGQWRGAEVQAGQDALCSGGSAASSPPAKPCVIVGTPGVPYKPGVPGSEPTLHYGTHATLLSQPTPESAALTEAAAASSAGSCEAVAASSVSAASSSYLLLGRRGEFETYRLPTGVKYGVAGEPPDGTKMFAALSAAEKARALALNPDARRYFENPHLMFYFGTWVFMLNGTTFMVLRDHCADVNLISEAAARKRSFKIKPSECSLTTGNQQKTNALGELDTEGLYITLLAGTRHETRLPLTKTLVVPTTRPFDFLAGNEPFHQVADCITQYPSAQPHFYPNLAQQPGWVVSVPMVRMADALAASVMTCVEEDTKSAVVPAASTATTACTTHLNSPGDMLAACCSSVSSVGDKMPAPELGGGPQRPRSGKQQQRRAGTRLQREHQQRHCART
ncbi:hypothetical protein Vretifemale_5715, partial [Volvox reticuliferus]